MRALRRASALVTVLALVAGSAAICAGWAATPEARMAGGADPATASTQENAQAKPQSAKIVINEQGFEPSKVSLKAGTPARLTFVRTTDKTCATEVVFPSLKIKRALPLNEPVLIDFTPSKTGHVAFACGMNMLKGVVVVE